MPETSETEENAMNQPMQQNPETGQWEPAKPLPYIGWKARLEDRLRQRGWKRLPNLLAVWDERGLGR